MSIKAPHIAMFMSSLRGGGAERSLINVANTYVSRGIRVDMLAAQAVGEHKKTLDQRINLINLGKNRTISTVPALIRYLRKSRPDALISTVENANIAAIFATQLAQTNTRNAIQIDTNIAPLLRERKSLKRRIIMGVMPFIYRRADTVIAVSTGCADSIRDFAGIDPARLHIIYNPVNLEAVQRMQQEDVPALWPQDGIPTVIAVGRLETVKDFPTLFRAFSHVRANRPARLVILGEGSQRASLSALITELGLQDDITLPGFVGNPFAYMKRADIFALSSVREGLPTVLVEALACGTPVVSTNCESGPDEILENGRWGMLVPVGDANALANAIIQTLDKPLPSSDLTRRAEDFSVDIIADKYLKAIFGEDAGQRD